jgi:hypothetical protein
MRKLTIEAASLESARHIVDALADFDPELVDDGEGLTVAIAIGSDRQLIGILNALEQHVTARNEGPALVGLGERKYRLDAAPSLASSPGAA